MGIYTPPIDPTVHCDGFKDTFNGINIKDNVNFYAPMALQGPRTASTSEQTGFIGPPIGERP
jgi:hypothetical protein